MYKLDFNKRPLSWSAISSFNYSPEQWYKRYILNEVSEPSAEMEFGSKFAQSIEDGTCAVKELMDQLQKKKEHKFSVVFNGIPLVGYGDAFCNNTFKKLDEVKTGYKEWDTKRVDEHGQITMYNLMNYITNRVRPEEVTNTLYWLPTQKNNDFTISFVQPIKVHAFRTKRTMVDILKFGECIKKTVEDMQKYIDEREFTSTITQ